LDENSCDVNETSVSTVLTISLAARHFDLKLISLQSIPIHVQDLRANGSHKGFNTLSAVRWIVSHALKGSSSEWRARAFMLRQSWMK
jgi:hypothetical protein